MINPTVLLANTANNMTGTDVLTSTPLDMRQWMSACFFMLWTGTPTGTFLIQASADYGINATATWVDVTSIFSGSLSNPAGGSGGNNLVDCNRTGFPWLRIKYTNASGTGTLQVIGNAKGF